MNPFESIARIRYTACKLGAELEGVWLNERDTMNLARHLCHTTVNITEMSTLSSMYHYGVIPEPFRLCGLTIHSVKT